MSEQKMREALENLRSVVTQRNCAGMDWGDQFGDLMTALGKADEALVQQPTPEPVIASAHNGVFLTTDNKRVSLDGEKWVDLIPGHWYPKLGIFVNELGRIIHSGDEIQWTVVGQYPVAQQPAAVVELTDQEIAEAIMGANNWPNNVLPTYLSIKAVRAVIAAHTAKQQEKGHAE